MQGQGMKLATKISICKRLVSRPGKGNRFRDGSGLTLVELMVVMAIVGILSAVAIPLVLSWLPDIRLKGAARDLYGIVMKTKGEAIKRGGDCTLVFGQVIGGTTFAYVLFEDNNATPGRNSDYDTGEPIIVRQELWPQNVILGANGASLGAGNITFPVNNDGYPAITFRSTSIPTGNGGGLINGAVSLTNTNGRTRTIVVNQAGNVRIN